MPGLGHKIKDALTPGHKHREGEAMRGQETYANEPMGTAAPVGTNSAGVYNEGPYTTASTGLNEGVAGTNAGGLATEREGVSMRDEGVREEGVRATGEACETRTFTEVEDRPVMKERVERIVEHRPVEKQFVVETRPVGEREMAEGVQVESAGVREYEVERVEGVKCPTSTEGNRNVL